MCQFFSCLSDGNGKVFYFDAEMRRKILEGETKYHDTDSHTSIADFFGYKGKGEDELNKWEYSPLTGELIADQINTIDDRFFVEEFCGKLNFSTVVPELVIKPVIHPLQNVRGEVDGRAIALLKRWMSVGDSVWAYIGDSVWAYVGSSVWAYVGASVRDSVRASVWDSVWDSAWNSVGDSAWNSVGDSAWNSVGDSAWDPVWDSVWKSVGAYVGSFFILPSWKYTDEKDSTYPFQPCVDLWERGLVPSFDGTTWRLHAGKDAAIVYEWTPDESGS